MSRITSPTSQMQTLAYFRMTKSTLLERFDDQSPALAAKFFVQETNETPTIVPVENRLGAKPNKGGITFLNSIGTYNGMSDFVSLYSEHSGFELCRTYDSRLNQIRPLLEFKRAEEIRDFTNRYLP